jgi:hypothetical protein
MQMTVKVYSVSKADVLKVGQNPCILYELTLHTELNSPVIDWPDVFYVKIDVDTHDETNGIQYFKTETMDTEKPFLIMGFSDTSFTLTAAFLSLVGKEKPS